MIGYLNFVIIFCFVQVCLSMDCKRLCSTCTKSPKCGPGITPVKDVCGCCKFCPKQLREDCNAENPCDHTKNLYCSFAEPGQRMGICTALPGKSCLIDNKFHLNGESFSRGLRFSCTCFDGDIKCQPLCPAKLKVPINCSHPRLVKRPRKPCMQWICQKPRKIGRFEEQTRINDVSSHQLKSGIVPKPNYKDDCSTRSTQWSSCSKTCGWGISYRFTNDNKRCKYGKQVRLCQIRSCASRKRSLKYSKKRSRSTLIGKPVRYTFLGCRSRVFVPKYCPTSCTPRRTTTTAASFTCDNGKVFRKNIMQIKSCSCKNKDISR